MKKIDINDIPMLAFDAGIPDSHWGETTTSSVTSTVYNIVVLIT